MGKNTKILATVVPLCLKKTVHNGTDGYILHFALTLTPRLPDSGSLSDYYEISNWPRYVETIKQDIKLDFSYNNSSSRQDCDATLVSTRPANAGKFWGAMFNASNPVSGWVVNEDPYKFADSITRSYIQSELSKGINECIEELLTNGDLGDDKDPYLFDGDVDGKLKKMGSLIEYLENLKTKSQQRILIDPILQNPTFKPRLRHFYSRLERIINNANQYRQDILLQLSVAEVEKRNYDETSEFHKRFAAYSNHPYLLKETGWIFEYTIPVVAPELLTNEGFLKIKRDEPLVENRSGMAPNQYEHFLQEIDFIKPWTSIDLRANGALLGLNTRFAITGRLRNTDASLFDIDDLTGYVRIGGDLPYRIKADLVDKQQLLARIEDLLVKNYEQNAADVSADIRNTADVLKAEAEALHREQSDASGTNEYVTSGISISIENLKDIIKDNVVYEPGQLTERDGAPADAEKVAGSGVIYRHNLMAGLRLDVIGYNGINLADKFITGSLGRKLEVYDFADNAIQNEEFKGYGNAGPELWKEYEGSLIESTQGSNSGKLYVDEELVRWNDTSVIATEEVDYNGLAEDLVKEPLDVIVNTVAGTLVPLRFGWKYSFAFRPADIIGYGQRPIDENGAFNHDELKQYLHGTATATVRRRLEPFWTNPIYYQRVESVNSPLVFLGNPVLAGNAQMNGKGESTPSNDNTLHKDDVGDQGSPPEAIHDWLPARFGEDVTTLVIRSYYQGPDQMSFKPLLTTTRYIAPPRANWNFVVQHGKLDLFFEDLLELPENANARLIEQTKDEFLDAAEVKKDTGMHKIVKPGRLDYMFDPVVNGFEMIVDNVVKTIEWTEPRPLVEKFYAHKYWKRVEYYRLKLDELSFSPDDLEVEVNGTEIVCRLKKGIEKIVLLGCKLEEKTREEIEVRKLFAPGIPRTRRTALKLVHAVQKPCLTSQAYDQTSTTFLDDIPMTLEGSITRLAGQSVAKATFSFKQFPVKTTGSYILHISYYNLEPDRYAEEGFRLTAVSKIVLSGFQPDQDDMETNVKFSGLEHVFEDTRYRRVQYRMEAVSKFKQYFHPSLAKGGFSVFGSLTRPAEAAYLTDDLLQQKIVTGKNYEDFAPKWQVLPSTKQPDAPVLDRIVPLIEWDEKTPGLVKRSCTGVRIYFDCDWYSSGPEEELAVFFMDQYGFNSGNVLDPRPTPEFSLESILSQFGEDPIAKIIEFRDTTPSNFFVLNHSSFDKTCSSCESLLDERKPGENVPYNIPIETLDFEKPAASDIGSREFKLQAMIFPVNFHRNPDDSARKDEEQVKGKFYVDIHLEREKLKSYYFPFIRFAVARYQKNTIEGKPGDLDLRFSKVVVTDFVQLLPYRELDITGNNSVKLISPMIREIKPAAETKQYSVYNELYVLKETEVGQSLFTYEDNTVILQGNITGTETELTSQAVFPDSYIVAEYEMYRNAPGGVQNDYDPEHNDPRIDYTRRLVFSYFAQPTKSQQHEKTK